MAADWLVVGQQDGAQGFDPKSRFERHTKACARINVIPDQTLWNQGYRQGLFQYCRPLNGLSVGQSGKAYNRVCSPETEPVFLRGYQLGKREFDLKSSIRSSQSNISSVESNIDELEDDLDEAKSGDKSKLRRKIRDKRRDLRDTERSINDMERDLAVVRRDIDWFRQNPGQAPPSSN